MSRRSGPALGAAGALACLVGALAALLVGGSQAPRVSGNPLPHPVPARVVVVPNVVGMSVGRAQAAVSHSRLRFRPSPAGSLGPIV